MGLVDPDPLQDGGGGGGGGVGSTVSATVACSICLEVVIDGGDRSTANLPCGHRFHLDCIGSAFNAKGAMQCPNCRKVEKGNWLYPNGYRSFPEFNMEDWMHDDDIYDISYSEMPFGVHFCPFSRVARIPFSYEDNEYFSSLAHNDLLGQRPVFSEYPGSSLYHHACPYLGHLHPPPPSSSSGPQVSTESSIDGPNFHHWNSIPPPPIDMSNSHTFPAVEPHHQNWDSHSHPSNHVTGEQASGSSPPARPVRVSVDPHLRSIYANSFGQGSGPRANTSATAPTVHPYVGNARGQVRHEGHTSYMSGMRGALPFSGGRRFGSTRSLGPIGPTPPPPSEHPGFFFFSHFAASSRVPQDTETSGGSNLYAWERDRLAPFPLLPVDRDFPWWGPPPTQATAPSDSGSRTTFWPRHSTERPSSQPLPLPPTRPRLHPFI